MASPMSEQKGINLLKIQQIEKLVGYFEFTVVIFLLS